MWDLSCSKRVKRGRGVRGRGKRSSPEGKTGRNRGKQAGTGEGRREGGREGGSGGAGRGLGQGLWEGGSGRK